MPPLPLAIHCLIAIFFIFIFFSYIFGLCYPAWSKALKVHKNHVLHADFCFAYACSPLLIALLSCLLLFFSQSQSLFIIDHCHDGQCGNHLPAINTEKNSSIAIISIVMLIFLFAIFIFIQKFLHSFNFVKRLLLLSKSDNNYSFQIVESLSPMAWNSGFFYSKIFISSGMIKLMNEQQMHSIICHENMHCKRKDNLKKFFLKFFCKLWPKSSSNVIKSDFYLSSEMHCDYYAAQALKNPSVVASALYKLQNNGEPSIHCPGDEITFRINELEKNMNIRYSFYEISLILVSICFSTILSLLTYHYLIELFL